MNLDRFLVPLFEHFQVNEMVHVRVNAIDSDSNDSAIAYCEYLGEVGTVHFFEIEYEKNISPSSFETMLAHECTHIAQELGGVEMDYTKEYHEQSHEIEAYDMQEWLVMNSKIN